MIGCGTSYHAAVAVSGTHACGEIHSSLGPDAGLPSYHSFGLLNVAKPSDPFP